MQKIVIAGLAVLGAALIVSGVAQSRYPTLNGQMPLVIGHRGASGYLPEHTLESYKLAIEMGADYIEPDLVATKDGVLIARHEPNMIATTDVSSRPEFADRKSKKMVDGIEEEGFFASDFTLAEIKTLRAVQAFGERPQLFNGQFQIPTLEEVIALAKTETEKRKRVIGIYPETKHPTFHEALNLKLEDRLIAVLEKAGWNNAEAPVFIQSFEQSNLMELNKKTNVRLVQLLDADDVTFNGKISFAAPYDRPFDWVAKGDQRNFGDLLTREGLKEIKSYADGVGPWKRYIVSVKAVDKDQDGKADDINNDGAINDADKITVVNSNIIREAHRQGLLVHTWTFRNELRRLASNYKGDATNEYKQFYTLGIDGVFSDFPDTAVRAR